MPEGISRSQWANPISAAFIFDREPWGPVFIADLIKVPRLSIAINVSVRRYMAPHIIATINLRNHRQRQLYYRHVLF